MRGYLIVLALSVGCGGRAAGDQVDAGGPVVDSAVEETPRTPRTIERACAEQVDARCRDLETCGRFSERIEYASEADCRTAALARCKQVARSKSTPTQAVARTRRPGPQEACSDRSFFMRPFCVHRRCEEPQFRKHAQCIELDRQREARLARAGPR